MAKALMEWETIDADQVNDIIEGRPPRPPKPPASTQTPPPPSQGSATAPVTATPAREA